VWSRQDGAEFIVGGLELQSLKKLSLTGGDHAEVSVNGVSSPSVSLSLWRAHERLNTAVCRTLGRLAPALCGLILRQLLPTSPQRQR
jgi:hypothetical protein